MAAAEGLSPGLTLADARALLPQLAVADADPPADAAALAMLADWCGRYTPWAATDGEDGLRLDITGSAHLFGGEAAMLAEILRRFTGFGITARGAIADTPAAAWAWARHGDAAAPILPAGQHRALLAPLPVAALHLPEEILANFERLGLRTIGDVVRLPRAPLAARFGELPLRRLDQLQGIAAEPISPRQPPAPWRTRIAFAEPIGLRSDLDLATRRLLEELCQLLAKDQRGLRQLDLLLYRVDGTLQRLAAGTSRASRDPAHLFRLFTEKLETVDPGFGIEVMLLEATATDPLPASQLGLSEDGQAEAALAELVDRLQNRLGARQVVRIAPFDSHVPERAVTLLPGLVPLERDGWTAEQPRPVRLLPCPEPIEVIAPVPDDPPQSFRWRRVAHRVVKADGPERIAPEWWRPETSARTRDYYHLEDEAGRRFWVYRDGLYAADAAPRWYLHGLFA